MDLNREAWRLEWIASGLLNPDEDMWEACNQSLVKALNSVHQKIRKELGVPGSLLAREPGLGGGPS
ncbi:hypothetical protein ACOZ38_27855 [Sphaerisporangium viridialbum]|uniref:hypothetical protein n=1 Tax=Sphaerisporangium viridialbum TaxID=46189 RepID=UPI003C7711D8